MESHIMLFSANPEFSIMETAVKESSIISYSENPESPIIKTAIMGSPLRVDYTCVKNVR
jgi:hypothetical protein